MSDTTKPVKPSRIASPKGRPETPKGKPADMGSTDRIRKRNRKKIRRVGHKRSRAIGKDQAKEA